MMVFRDGCYVPAGPGNARHGMPNASVFRVSNPPDIHRVGPPIVNPATLRAKVLSVVPASNGPGFCVTGSVDATEPGVVSLYRQTIPEPQGEPSGAEGEELEKELDGAFDTWWTGEREGFGYHNPAKRDWLGYADFCRGKEQRFSVGPIRLGRGHECAGDPDADGSWRLVVVVSSGQECQRVKENIMEAKDRARAALGRSSSLGAGLGLDLEVRPRVPEGDELPIDLEEHTCFRVRQEHGWLVALLKQSVRVGDDMFEAEGVMYGCLGKRVMPSGWRRGSTGSNSGRPDTPRSERSTDGGSRDGASTHEEEEAGATTCVICMLEPRDTALLPCRHLCLCSGCADVVRLRSQACPICRETIKSLLSIDAPIEVA